MTILKTVQSITIAQYATTSMVVYALQKKHGLKTKKPGPVTQLNIRLKADEIVDKIISSNFELSQFVFYMHPYTNIMLKKSCMHEETHCEYEYYCGFRILNDERIAKECMFLVPVDFSVLYLDP